MDILGTLPDHLNDLNFITFSKNSPYLVGYSSKNLYFSLYNTVATCCLKIQKRLECCANCICLSDDTSVALGLENGVIKILDVEKNKYIFDIKGHASKIKNIDVNSLSKLFATTSDDKTMKVWDIRIRNAFRTLNFNENVEGDQLKISPDGTWVAISCDNGDTILYDIIMNKIVYSFPNTGYYSSINFHPDELILSSSSKMGQFNFWELTDFTSITSFKINDDPITCTKFHADGLCLFIGTDSGKIYSIDWESNTATDHVKIENSIIHDIFYHDNNIYFIAPIEGRISILQTPNNLVENSTQILNNGSCESTSSNKTFDRTPADSQGFINLQRFIYSETIVVSFKSGNNDDVQLHSTPID
ncbi:hypothetical protein HZS_1488, partial [Henneguya salminicola]